MRRFVLTLVVFYLLLVIAVPTSAHSGKTDGNGGHHDWSTGEYHYHHGYPAHQHYDIDNDGTIDCPYDFNDRTSHSPGGGSASGVSAKTYSEGYADGHADGYDEGVEDGYEAGKTNGYKSGYDAGIKDAEKEKDSAVRETRKEAHLDAAIVAVLICAPAVFIGTNVLLIGKMDKEREEYRKTIKAQNEIIGREKNRCTLLRAGKTDTADRVPSDVVLLHYCIPIKGVASKEKPYGSYTVFVSAGGKRYHARRGCSNASTPIHFFEREKGLAPCSLCVKPGIYPDKAPDWYQQIKNE